MYSLYGAKLLQKWIDSAATNRNGADALRIRPISVVQQSSGCMRSYAAPQRTAITSAGRKFATRMYGRPKRFVPTAKIRMLPT